MNDINLLLGATKVDFGEEHPVMYKVGDKAYSENAYLSLLKKATLELLKKTPLEQKEERFRFIVK